MALHWKVINDVGPIWTAVSSYRTNHLRDGLFQWRIHVDTDGMFRTSKSDKVFNQYGNQHWVTLAAAKQFCEAREDLLMETKAVTDKPECLLTDFLRANVSEEQLAEGVIAEGTGFAGKCRLEIRQTKQGLRIAPVVPDPLFWLDKEMVWKIVPKELKWSYKIHSGCVVCWEANSYKYPSCNGWKISMDTKGLFSIEKSAGVLSNEICPGADEDTEYPTYTSLELAKAACQDAENKIKPREVYKKSQ